MENRQGAKVAKGLQVEPSGQLDNFARRVIGAAIEVHRHLGPGFSERVYEEALALEFGLRQIPFARQPSVPVVYKGAEIGHGRPDFVVGAGLVVEVKTVGTLLEVHQAQVISYLKAMNSSLGLLLNFRETTLRRGIKRVVWSKSFSLQREEKTNHVHEAHEARDRFVVARGDTPVSLDVVEENLDTVA
jgi:GxxExxY protein